MSFPLDLALRYMGSKRRAFISVGTMFATLGVALGVGALATVMSVTGGFRAQFRDKILGVNAHVLVMKYASDFREYRKVMDTMRKVPGVVGVAPFVINPMMITHKDRTATGVLLKGVDPVAVKDVLDLPRNIVEGSLDGLRLPDSKPSERRRRGLLDDVLEGTSSSALAPPSRAVKDSSEGTLPTAPSATASPSAAGSPSAANAPPSPSAAPSASTSADSATSPERASLLRDIERIIADDAALADPIRPDAPASKRASADAEAAASDSLPEGAPVGSIVPDGGYAGELPEDDELPAELDPDPCRDPQAIKKLPGIVVGITLKRNLEIALGDCLQVTSPTIGFSYARGGAMRAPVAKQFRVIAVFDAGFDQYDSKLVYTDLYESQAFYDTGDSVTGVEMTVSNIDKARAVAQEIDRRLGNSVYHTLDWEELNHGLFTALQIQQLLMSLVLALIIVVAAFTVIATLIMVVLDKKKEIAVLKAMGASDSALLRSFLYQGGIIGVIGAVFGLALGYVTCKFLLVHALPLDPKVYFISRVPVQLRPVEFVLVGLFAVVICLVATVWPALYAARLRPADAFRDQQ